jgi:hypothetical protein
MSEGTAELVGFAYGEDLEPTSGRSLGYRLLAPLAATSWTGEVEALARRLQAAPYPDTWPAVDLFCSALLSDGQRIVALARYGLSDHTAAHRRGGLELVGVVSPAGLGVQPALALYRWLVQRRAAEDDLHRLGGTVVLADVLAATPAADSPPPDTLAGPVPVLPVRLWHEGVFLFAAAAPSDPDHHLRLLELASTTAPSWQWLPLVGPDFPLSSFAQRGPLVAWTPHLAGVAVRLERTAPALLPSLARRRSRAGRLVVMALLLCIVGLLGGNLWYMRQVQQALTAVPAAPPTMPEPKGKEEQAGKMAARPGPEDDSRDRFARALGRLVRDRAGRLTLEDRTAVLDRYDAVVRRYPDLAVANDNEEGKRAVVAAWLLAGHSAERIDEMIRKALEGKGFSDRIIQAARAHVREQLDEVKER